MHNSKPTHRKKHKKNKRAMSTLVETLLIVCGLFTGIGILLPIHMAHKKEADIQQNFYTNVIENQAEYSKFYKNFWEQYEIALKQRGDSDGNKVISVEERQYFATQFFGNLDLKVNNVTTVVTKSDGTRANPDALLCNLRPFKEDNPWIRPVCPEL
jgi:hypothetical protein